MDISQIVPLALSFIGMAAIGIIILVNDFKLLSVKMWMLLLFVLIGFLGVFVARVCHGDFSPMFLLAVPIYVLLNLMNTYLNKNRFIGQADIDILNGTLSLLIPMGILSFSKDYGNQTISDAVAIVAFGGLMLELLSWLLFGFLIAILAAVVKYAVKRILSKKESKKVDLEKTVIINSQEPETTVMEKLDESKVADNKKKKLRGTKIPVCISFMPMYFYMVYAAILFKL